MVGVPVQNRRSDQLGGIVFGGRLRIPKILNSIFSKLAYMLVNFNELTRKKQHIVMI